MNPVVSLSLSRSVSAAVRHRRRTCQVESELGTSCCLPTVWSVREWQQFSLIGRTWLCLVFESSLLFQQGIATCSSRSKRNCQSSVWRRMAWDARGLRGSAFQGRVSPGPAKRMNRDFPLAVADTVACIACWVALCSPKLVNLCLMTDKTELWRQVNRSWRRATEQPFRMWRSVAGFPQRIQPGSTWLIPCLRRLVAVGAVSAVAWRAKQSSASLQFWISCCHERSWCMWLDQSIHLPCNWTFRRCSSCSATSMSQMYLFTCFRIVCGERGFWREFWMPWRNAHGRHCLTLLQ